MAADDPSSQIEFGIHLGAETASRPIDPGAPFRIAVIGDFSGRAQQGTMKTGTELARQHPRMVDRDNFEEVMQQLDVRLEQMLVGPDQQSVSLRLETLDDFEPDRLFDQVDLFASLRSLRRRLMKPERFEEAAKEVLSWAPNHRETSATPAEETLDTAESIDRPQVGDLLDSILDNPVDGPRTDTGGIRLQLDRLVAEIAAPYALPASDPRQPELVACVDSAIQATMLAMLHHPSFKQLEADWRSLHRLVFGLETDASLKVFLIDISKQELVTDLMTSDDLTQTYLHRLLVEQSVQTPGGEPWAMVVASSYFGCDERDTSILGRLAKVGAAAGAAVVAGAQPGVLGSDDVGSISLSSDWRPTTNEHWKQLCGLPESAYLGLLWPRFLLRLPYGASTKPVEAFEFEEVHSIAENRRLLWGNPAFLFAEMMGQSFTRSGWSLSLGEVCETGEMPVWIYEDEGESQAHPCGERMMNENTIGQVSACGVMPVISFLREAKLRVGGFHSVSGTPLRGGWD